MRSALLFILGQALFAQAIPFPGPGVVHSVGAGTTLIGNGQIGGNSTITTTPTVNTTTGAATIIFGGTTAFGQPTTSAVTDSASNSLIGPSNLAFETISGLDAGLFFKASPTTSTTHSMQLAGSGFFGDIFFCAFSGTTMSYQGTWVIGTTYAADDVVIDPNDLFPYMSIAGGNVGNVPHTSSGQWRVMMAMSGNASTSSQQGGSVTPLHNNALIISLVVADVTAGTITKDAAFTQIGTTILQVGGAHVAGAWSYLHQGTAAAINPTWTTSNGPGVMGVINFWVNGT